MIIKLRYKDKGTKGFYLDTNGEIKPATIYSTVAHVVDGDVAINYNIASEGFKWIKNLDFFCYEESAIEEKLRREKEADKKERRRLIEERKKLRNEIEQIKRQLKPR